MSTPTSAHPTPLPESVTGWPRPRLGEVKTGELLPAPFVARRLLRDGAPAFDGANYDDESLADVRDHWLCQVCGEGVPSEPYGVSTERNYERRGATVVSGGPLCSLRCSRLTIAVCPHFEGEGVVFRFDRPDASWSDLELEVARSSVVEVVAA